jgi:hypothetical protein
MKTNEINVRGGEALKGRGFSLRRKRLTKSTRL